MPSKGTVRLRGDALLVTYYVASNVNQLRLYYEDLPSRLAEEGLAPEVPWLYGYKLVFRFC